MYRFKWPLCKKSAVLVLVCWYKARCGREQELWGYWLPEGCIKQWCDKRSGYGCLSKKCELGEHEAVTLLYLVPWPSCPTYRVKTQDWKRYVSHHWPVSPVTQQLGLCFLYCFSGLSAILLLTYAVACKSEVMNWTVCSVIHILGFITPNFLHICVMITATLAIFQELIWVRVCIGKCLTSIPIRHMVRLFEFYCECTAIRRNFKFWFVWLLFFFCIYSLLCK